MSLDEKMEHPDAELTRAREHWEKKREEKRRESKEFSAYVAGACFLGGAGLIVVYAAYEAIKPYLN